MGTLLENEGQILLEVGPGQALGSFVRQHPACGREQMGLILPTLPYAHQQQPDLAFLLETLGKLWLLGTAVHWPGFYQHEQRHRLPLPTYPFQPASFWLQGKQQPFLAAGQEEAPNAATPDAAGIVSPPRLPLDEWFYLPVWNQTGPRPWPQDQTEEAEWLIFVEDGGVGEEVSDWLRAAQHRVITVRPGPTFAQMDAHQYMMRPGAREEYTLLWQSLQRQGISPQKVVHFWNMAEEPPFSEAPGCLEETLDRSFYSLLYLIQAAGEVGFQAFELSVVTSPVQVVTGHETICPAKMAVMGPIRTIPVEFPQVRCRCIDVEMGRGGSWQQEALGQNLLAELTAVPTETIVALRGHQRWAQAFDQVQLTAVDMDNPPVLRPQGVYWITGGLGGIGMGIAEYLARTVQAKLILTGRSGLPSRDTWGHHMETTGENSTLGRKIRQVQQLEALGAEVLVMAADVADEQQMRTAVQQALARFGTIHGVIHMAGVPGMGLIQLKTAETADSILSPKLQGTLVLERVLADVALDFLALFSSETSFTGGGLGQIDYCAANAFMDAYAQSQMGRKRRTVSINWGEWQWNAWEEGMEGFGPEIEAYFRQTRAHYGIHFDEGQEALLRVLAHPLPQVVVSTRDFRQIMAWAGKVTIEQILAIAGEGQETRPKHTRPSLGVPYVAPSNELEEIIAAVWGDVLGIDEIGVHDDFFDLGGHSLIATQVMTRLRQQLQAHLPLSLVLTAPTVAELAIAVEMTMIEELEGMEGDELYNANVV